jgi:hypothetical protein
MYIVGLSPAAAKVLERGGIGDVLGPDGMIVATTRLFGGLDEAVERGRRWIASGGFSDTSDFKAVD